MNNDDELLNEITAYLRNESIPEMPRPTASSRAASQPRRWVWGAAAAGAMAASFGAFLIWRGPATDPAPRQVDVTPAIVEDRDYSNVVVLPVDLAAPLVQLEAQLDSMDAEIAELRVKAALLDARRKADALLVRR